MPDESIKQRFRRATKAVLDELNRPKGFYKFIVIGDPSCPFQIERWRDHPEKCDEVLKVRVCLDKITDHDIDLCKRYNMPGKIFTKLIMCRRADSKECETVEI